MTTTIPSGLGATLGLVKESTWGTDVTVSRWFLIDANEGFQLKKHIVESKALNTSRFGLSKRRVVPTTEATGKFTLDAVQTGLGLVFQNITGGSPTVTQQGGSAAWLQNHVPGTTLQGSSVTFQKGVPMTPSGTVQALTYGGSKIVDFELSCKANEIAKITCTVDSKTEETGVSYAAPTLPATKVFHFDQGAVLIGQTTVTTSAGLLTVFSGGAAPTGVVTSVSFKITNHVNNARYNVGAVVKSEQIENAFTDVTGELEIEFATLADVYTAMAADTTTPMEINFTDTVAIASTYYPFIRVRMPAVRWDDAGLIVQSEDVVKVKVPFKVLNDGVNPVYQIDYMSVDTAY